MGYTTEFEGGFKFNKPVDDYLGTYINQYNLARHMTYDVAEIKTEFPDTWKDFGFKGNLGDGGSFYIGPDSPADVIIDYNTPPVDCPGLWCQWLIEDDTLIWDGGEKFYNYTEWLEFLIKNFFAPSGYKLNGEVKFRGEDPDDHGVIVCKDNKVSVIYDEDEEFDELDCLPNNAKLTNMDLDAGGRNLNDIDPRDLEELIKDKLEEQYASKIDAYVEDLVWILSRDGTKINIPHIIWGRK